MPHPDRTGESTDGKVRVEDKRRFRIKLRENAYRDFWLLAISVIVLFALVSFANEGKERRDETCKRFEREEAQEVRRLVNTYSFLGRLPDSELFAAARAEPGGQLRGLYIFAVQNITTTEQDALTALAPDYCNETYQDGYLWWAEERDVGLSEPRVPAEFPKRPERIERAVAISQRQRDLTP